MPPLVSFFLKYDSMSWTIQTSQIATPPGDQMFKYTNEPRGTLLQTTTGSKGDLCFFLGTKGRERLLDLIATLLVLQFLYTKLEQEGMAAKSLIKMDDVLISRCFNVIIRNVLRIWYIPPLYFVCFLRPAPTGWFGTCYVSENNIKFVAVFLSPKYSSCGLCHHAWFVNDNLKGEFVHRLQLALRFL